MSPLDPPTRVARVSCSLWHRDERCVAVVFRLLTDRQADVIWLLCQRRSPRQVAALLGIGVTTVGTYLQNIRSRLGVTQVSEICLMVEEDASSYSRRPAAARDVNDG